MDIKEFENFNNKELQKLLKKIEKDNLYLYNRLKQQMDLYITRDGLFKPDESFYDFIDDLFNDNYKDFKKILLEELNKTLQRNYYYWFYLYFIGKPKELKNEKQIINETEANKTLNKIINKNQENIKKDTIKTIRNLVILGKSAEFITKIVKNKIEFNNYIQGRITDTETTRIITEARQEARDELNLNKIWVSTTDKRTRNTHKDLDGQETKDLFKSKSGSTGQAPGKMSKKEENINCRCRIVLESNKTRYNLDRKIRISTGKNIVVPYETYEDYIKHYSLGDF